MNRISILICTFFTSIIAMADNVVTVYYDKDFKGVSSAPFATYVATFSSSEDPHYGNKYIIKYAKTGRTFSEGSFKSYDKYNFNNSEIYNYKKYYTNGRISEMCTGDLQDYEFKTYYSNGKKKDYGHLVNGKVEGDFYTFDSKKDIYVVLHYNAGKLTETYDYYNHGLKQIYKMGTTDQIKEPITPNDKKLIEDNNGGYWQEYKKNGIIIQARAVLDKNYGKYWSIQLAISNYTKAYFDLDLSQTKIYKIEDGEETPLKILSADEYIKKVVRKQKNRMFWASFASGMANSLSAERQAYSTTTIGRHTYHTTVSYTDSYALQQANERSQQQLAHMNFSVEAPQHDHRIISYFQKPPFSHPNILQTL